MIGGRKIFANTSYLMLSSVVNLAISLFTTTIIARSIGPELYGRYSFGLNFVLIFSVLANFGLESLYIREAARDRDNIALLGDIFRMKIVLAFGAAFVSLAASYLLGYPAPTRTVIFVLSAGMVFQVLAESLLSLYRAREQMQVPALASTVFRVVSAAIIAASVFGGVGFRGIVGAYTIANGLIFVLVLVLTRGEVPLRLPPGFRDRAVRLARQGTPFFQSALLTMFYAKINILLLSKYASEEEMGYYLAGLNLVENLFFIPTAFITSVFPAFSRIFGASADTLRQAYDRIVKYLVILTAAVTAGTLIVGREVVNLIYGSQFLPAVPVLQVLIFFWTCTFFSQTQSTLLFSIGRERTQVRIMLAACVVNLALTWAGLAFFGYLGAAVASVLTEAFVVACTSTALWRLGYHSRPDRFAIPLALALVAMVVAARSLLGAHVLLAVAGGALAYVLGLFLFRVFDDQDRVYLRGAASRGR